MSFRWGVFGTGAISTKFVVGLAAAPGAKAEFIASRSLAKAEAFAGGVGIAKAIEGYDQAAAGGGVDAVYIATPPSEHAAHALLCIQAGIPVLIEKPLASNAADAQRIADAARANGVFAMEAMWTRFLPAAQALRDQVLAKSFGDARIVTGSFGISYLPETSNSMFQPALGGGALAHLGAYPLSLAQWLFGTPTTVQALGVIGRTGVDEEAAFQLRYPQDVLASFFVSLRTWASDDFQVLGSTSMASFRGSIVRPYGLNLSRQEPRGSDQAQFGWKARLRQSGLVHGVAQRLARSSRTQGKQVPHPYRGNGYHYEAEEVRNCIAQGKIESAVMPLDDSISIAITTDTIRAAIHGASVQEDRLR